MDGRDGFDDLGGEQDDPARECRDEMQQLDLFNGYLLAGLSCTGFPH